MSVSEPIKPIKATSSNSTRLLTSVPMVVTTTVDKANNNHNRNIPRVSVRTSSQLCTAPDSHTFPYMRRKVNKMLSNAYGEKRSAFKDTHGEKRNQTCCP